MPVAALNTDKKDVQIMIVEDNFLCAYAITSILAQYQIESDIANNGQHAIQLVSDRFSKHKTTYKLIIMDLQMPVLNGFEAAKAIRSFIGGMQKIGPSASSSFASASPLA